MQVCEECGASAPDRADFCTSCGHRFPGDGSAGGAAAAGATAEPPTYAGVLVPPDPGPRRRPWAAGVAALAAVALLGGGFLLGRAVTDADRADGGGEEEPVADGGEDPPPTRLVPGDVVELPAADGAAIAELLVARSPGVVLRVETGTISVTDEEGTTVADDADDEVLELGPGLYTVEVVGIDEAVTLSAGEVVAETLASDRVVTGELTEEAPVLQVLVEPGVNRGWRLVDASPDEVDAVVHDATDLAAGEDVADAPVACDATDDECLLERGRRYLLRIRAPNLPVAYDLTFEDLVAASGPRSLLVDGEPAPAVVALADGETVTVALGIGRREDVVVRVSPAAEVDVALTVAGTEVDDGGPGAAEAVRLSGDDLDAAFGFFELEITAQGRSAPAIVTVGDA